MKKFLYLLLGVFFIFLFYSVTSHRSIPLSPHVTPTPQVQTYPFTTPVTLSIPKLNVHTKIESVGLDSLGRMDVPKDYQQVGWYDLGYKPGQKGSAVLAGHYDTPLGTPGVFYYVSTLKPHDLIKVQDTQNHTLTYEVEDVQTYPLDSFPLQTVFAKTDTYRLNLITCDGVFDKTKKLYNKRLVVYATLKSS